MCFLRPKLILILNDLAIIHFNEAIFQFTSSQVIYQVVNILVCLLFFHSWVMPL